MAMGPLVNGLGGHWTIARIGASLGFVYKVVCYSVKPWYTMEHMLHIKYYIV